MSDAIINGESPCGWECDHNAIPRPTVDNIVEALDVAAAFEKLTENIQHDIGDVLAFASEEDTAAARAIIAARLESDDLFYRARSRALAAADQALAGHAAVRPAAEAE